jgi:hypothetical protein
MPLEFWMVLWQVLFVLGVGLFAVLAVVVAIGGAFDIANLIRALRSQHREEPAAAKSDAKS